MKRKNIIVVAAVGILIVCLFFIWYQNDYAYIQKNPQHSQYVDFHEDISKRTLTVTNVYSLTNWEDIELYSGHALMPSGSIDVGDMIANCTGNVTLVTSGEHSMIGSWDFS